MNSSFAAASQPQTRIPALLKQLVKPVLLLGAGASVKSGIPLAGPLVELIARWSYCKAHDRSPDDPTLMRSDWWPWLRQQPWMREDCPLADLYPRAVEALLQPRTNRREFFQHVLRPGVPPSAGYSVLARLLARRVVVTVLTTNFDELVAESAKSVPGVHYIGQIRTPDDTKMFSTEPPYPQVVYLHGSVEHYTDQNIEQETQQLHACLIGLLPPLLRDRPLIVIGYRGTEPSVMKHLLIDQVKTCNSYRHGIFWCHLKSEPPVRTGSLLEQLKSTIGGNLQFVEVDGFDELMAEIERSLPDLAPGTLPAGPSSTEGQYRTDVYDLQPAPISLEQLNMPLLKAKLLAYCDAVRLPPPDTTTDANLRPALTERHLAIQSGDGWQPTNGCQLLFAGAPNAQLTHAEVQVTVCGPTTWLANVLDRPLNPATLGNGEASETVTIGGDLWSQLDQAANLLARVNRPFRLKGPVSHDVYPYPPLALKELLTNLLAHRDYSVQAPGCIRITPDEISFENPGGLVDHVRRQLNSDDIQSVASSGSRGIKGYRNPVVADFFFSAGAMDKEGSGLPDVLQQAANNLNKVLFGPTRDNGMFLASITCRPEALSIEPDTRTARTTEGELRYSPNLLRVVTWPSKLWRMGTSAKPNELSKAEHANAPPFCAYGSWIWTFASPHVTSSLPLRELAWDEEIHEITTDEALADLGFKAAMPRLLNMALTSHLVELGLRIKRESGRTRAYFPSNEGEPREVTYRGLFRQSTRTVAKPIVSRKTSRTIYWEHKAVNLRFERFGNDWCLALVPSYIFTIDGDLTPIASERIGSLSTRRASRDYNPSVLHDLVFWSRILSRGQEPTFSLIVENASSETPHSPIPCIELASVVPTVVFQEPIDAAMATEMDGEMSDTEIQTLQDEIATLVAEESGQEETRHVESTDR
jgi:hypothetical protein